MIYATINRDSPRYCVWQEIFGTAQVPLRSPLRIENDGPDGRKQFYRLATRALTPEVRERLITHVARKFNLPRAEVEQDIDDPRHGVPILAEDVIVSMDLRAFI